VERLSHLEKAILRLGDPGNIQEFDQGPPYAGSNGRDQTGRDHHLVKRVSIADPALGFIGLAGWASTSLEALRRAAFAGAASL
jgi:hypothetical protein